ncbi:YesL family protein [Metabacillus schmidteae]|uniref:YesL family protein n=1 Tax=Metabacillus schmidteae TaxID=2730405 RepID=UPI00158A42E8|nr:YesL family protein [Metabacillus schmidteae]
MKNVTSWYIRFGEWTFHLFVLNLLWCLFSVLGLFAFGIFPATVAMFAVMRKLIMSQDDVPMVKLFWQTFKAEFLKSNLIGYLFSIGGFILYVNIRVLQQLDSNVINLAFIILTFILAFLYLLTYLYVFPVFVHFHLKTRDYIKYAFILSIGKPLQSVLMILTLCVALFLYIKLPGIIPVFGVSLFCYIIMKISVASFPAIDSSQYQAEQSLTALSDR